MVITDSSEDHKSSWGNVVSTGGWGDATQIAEVTWTPRPPSPDQWGELPATPVSEPSDASGGTGMTTKLEAAWMQSRAMQQAGYDYGRLWRDGWKRSRRNVLKYMRRDFGELGWSYQGSPDRDTSLDDLPNQEWFFRSLPAARNCCAPPPTFMGPQIKERMAVCRSWVESGEEEVATLCSWVSDLKRHICLLKEEIEDISTELHDMEDLIYKADGKIHNDKDDLEDLEDIRLVALSWLQNSNVVMPKSLPSS
ncbi:hypothetical protein AAF712_016463 [Marasmius tenuissimus]|uniref:Uncharacterized protein n=1 Tax=Marasmius tenuissimus TaxID=585030 RepID=A0ABR2Z8V7_9AGAR